MGCFNQSNGVYSGGIPTELLQGHDSGDEVGSSDRLSVPDEFIVEAMVYPVVSKGYIPFKQLKDGTASWDDFIKATRLIEFEDWLVDASKKGLSKQDIVEYFE